MPAVVHRAEITEDRIDTEALRNLVSDHTTGAVVVFTGDVRNHDHGREVTSLTYESHPSAAEIIENIASEFASDTEITSIAIVHRVGPIPIGESALVVAVGSSHRGDAFQACKNLVDQVKEKLPVWKHQVFADGTDEWVNCA